MGVGLVGHERSFLREHYQVSLFLLTLMAAFIDNNSRTWIHAITRKLKGKPLLDLVGGVIEDYEFLWEEYYFPTATL